MNEPANWSLHFRVRTGGQGGRQWADAVRFGFLSGGWAPVPQRAFRLMEIGDQIWVRLTWRKGADPGYVARAVVVRQPAPVQDAVIVVDGQDVPFMEARKQMEGFYPASREEMDALDPEDALMRTTLTHAETDEWVVAVRWEGVLPVEERLKHDRIPSPGVQTGYRTRPADLSLLEAAIPRNIDADERLEWHENDFEVTPALIVDKAAKYAHDQERNVQAELTATWLAAVYYDRRDWQVKSVEHLDGLGYDLLATKGDKRRHIEVKGTSGFLAAPDVSSAATVMASAGSPRATPSRTGSALSRSRTTCSPAKTRNPWWTCSSAGRWTPS